MGDASIEKEGLRAEHDPQITPAVIVPVLLSWLDPGSATSLTYKVCEDVDDVVVPKDCAVARFVD
jgi:hypothetical protein